MLLQVHDELRNPARGWIRRDVYGYTLKFGEVGPSGADLRTRS